MKTVFLLLAFSITALADTVIVQTIEQTGPMALNSKSTTKIKGERMRVEPNAQSAMIVDLTTGDMMQLVPAQKMALFIPGSIMETVKGQLAASTAAKAGQSESASFQKTGRTDKINGYSAEEYEATQGGVKMNVWISKDVEGYQELQKSLSRMPIIAKTGGASAPDVGALDGFPVRMVVEAAGGAKTTVTVESVEQKTLPDSDFEIPKDYKKIDASELGQGGN